MGEKRRRANPGEPQPDFPRLSDPWLSAGDIPKRKYNINSQKLKWLTKAKVALGVWLLGYNYPRSQTRNSASRIRYSLIAILSIRGIDKGRNFSGFIKRGKEFYTP